MPIKGITDGQAALPIIGHLRKGGERQTKKGKDGQDYQTQGVDLEDRLRFDSEHRDVEVAFRAAYHDLLVTSLEVRLVGSTPDDVLDSWNEHYGAGGLLSRCDGETCVLRREGGRLQRVSEPCRAPQCFKDSRGRWQRCPATGRMSVLVPGLLEGGYIGRVILHTTSVNDLRRLAERLASADMVARAAGNPGGLSGLPVRLFRVKTSISMPNGEGGTVRRDKWLLDLEVDPSVVRAAAATTTRPALAQSDHEIETMSLPSPKTLGQRIEAATALGDFAPLYREADHAGDVVAASRAVGRWVEMVRLYIPRVESPQGAERMRQAIGMMPRCDGQAAVQRELDEHLRRLGLVEAATVAEPAPESAWDAFDEPHEAPPTMALDPNAAWLGGG